MFGIELSIILNYVLIAWFACLVFNVVSLLILMKNEVYIGWKEMLIFYILSPFGFLYLCFQYIFMLVSELPNYIRKAKLEATRKRNMTYYRKANREKVEAFVWDGVPNNAMIVPWFAKATNSYINGYAEISYSKSDDKTLLIKLWTECGAELAHPGDFIVRNVDGSLSKYGQDIFLKNFMSIKEKKGK